MLERRHRAPERWTGESDADSTHRHEKNWVTRGVACGEAEEVFFNVPLILALDRKHSKVEDRYYGLGVTNVGRALFVVFTIRGDLVRVISARDMSPGGEADI